MNRPIITDNKNGTINISAGELYSDNQVVDWAKPSIKLEKLHKRLDHCLNDKKHSEAFSILLEMQGEVLKLQQFVLYGIEVPRTKYDSIAEFEALLESARKDKNFIKELHAELNKVKLPGDDSACT